jgi:hypothetical protein
VAATTTAAAARDLIIFFINILPLLGPPNATAASTAPKYERIILRPYIIPHITILFSRL